MNLDEQYIRHCNELASKGLGLTAPNPMVGCVIVSDGKIISEGYHEKYGEAHAEVNAICRSDHDFSKSTLYVNLEPCSHFGKTPPCADLIISRKFQKVVIGCTDPNPLVARKGILKLKGAGIEVISGVLQKECEELNKRFFTFHRKKRPYIILKWAQTSDGFISKNPLPENKSENWISGEESKKIVHQWRSEEQAIMVGTTTVLNDDPELTTRSVKGKNPLRIIIDKDLKLDPSFKVFNGVAETLVFTNEERSTSNKIRFIKIDFTQNIIPQIFHQLYELNIQSVLVEGGTHLIQSIIDLNVWDEVRLFINPDKKFGNGIKAPYLNSSGRDEPVHIGKDLLFVHRNLL